MEAGIIIVQRPEHLPDFDKPPLTEVLMGIQFAQPNAYQQIRAGEVWALFKDKFPVVQELPPLPPYFETFGQPAGAQINFGFVAGAQHDRFWFTSPHGDELIQFQNDRLLHNWRKVQSINNEYPRFERIITEFEKEAKLLEKFFISIGGELNINQCEISYINHITPRDDNVIKTSDWLSFVDFKRLAPDDFSFAFRRKIHDSNGRPIGRLTCESATSARPDGQELISLTITARAMPERPDLKSALEFFKVGREMIVNLFAEVTADSAHKVWERKK